MTNGIISMDAPFFQFNPELFPIDSLYLVAPFWGDVAISNNAGVGDVSYQVYSSGSPLLNTVNAFIRDEKNFNFNGIWMLLAEWNDVPLFFNPVSEVSVLIVCVRAGCTHEILNLRNMY